MFKNWKNFEVGNEGKIVQKLYACYYNISRKRENIVKAIYLPCLSYIDILNKIYNEAHFKY
jgi:hypothetical protein